MRSSDLGHLQLSQTKLHRNSNRTRRAPRSSRTSLLSSRTALPPREIALSLALMPMVFLETSLRKCELRSRRDSDLVGWLPRWLTYALGGHGSVVGRAQPSVTSWQTCLALWQEVWEAPLAASQITEPQVSRVTAWGRSETQKARASPRYFPVFKQARRQR